jgi:hypothetical protein
VPPHHFDASINNPKHLAQSDRYSSKYQKLLRDWLQASRSAYISCALVSPISMTTDQSMSLGRCLALLVLSVSTYVFSHLYSVAAALQHGLIPTQALTDQQWRDAEIGSSARIATLFR